MAYDQNKLLFDNSEPTEHKMNERSIILHVYSNCLLLSHSWRPCTTSQSTFHTKHQQRPPFRLWKNWASLSDANSSPFTDIKQQHDSEQSPYWQSTSVTKKSSLQIIRVRIGRAHFPFRISSLSPFPSLASCAHSHSQNSLSLLCHWHKKHKEGRFILSFPQSELGTGAYPLLPPLMWALSAPQCGLRLVPFLFMWRHWPSSHQKDH